MSRGHNRERQVRDLLVADGWLVVRAAGSLGDFDLMAVKRGFQPRVIEVKSTIAPYDHFGPKDRAVISRRAAVGGAEAWLAWWPSRGKLRWIPEQDWPQQANERAIVAESTTLPERAMALESTKPVERATVVESTNVQERATFVESTMIEERALGNESTTVRERSKKKEERR